MPNPTDRKYSKDHTWVKVKGDIAEVGISDYAQRQLKEIVFVDLPAVKAKAVKGKACGSLESVKSVSDIKSPVSGEVVEANASLSANPGALNKEPFKSWVFRVKIKDAKELDSLMDAKAYEAQYK